MALEYQGKMTRKNQGYHSPNKLEIEFANKNMCISTSILQNAILGPTTGISDREMHIF